MPFPWTNYSHLSVQSKFCCMFHLTPFNRYSCHFWLFTIVNLTVTWYLKSNVPIIWKCPSQWFVLISELLLQIVHGSVNSDNATLELNSLQPSIYHTDKFVVGNPEVVQSPVGMGIRCTAEDRVTFVYPLTEPMPCPFDLNQCPDGFTFTMWFRAEPSMSNLYKDYMSLGTAFKMYRPPDTRLDFSWTNDGYRWWNGIRVPEEEWVHVAIVWNFTHTVAYLNGENYRVLGRQTSSQSARVENEIRFSDDKPGNYSVGRIDFWSGRASPVFIWKLYQNGL